MGSYLLNSGGLDDEIRVHVFPTASEPHQATTSELEWRSGDGQTGRSLNARATCFWSGRRHHHSTSETSLTASPSARPPGSKAIAPRRLGQAVTGGSLVWRRRRLRGVPSAVVDPGLRPRFFSVLPTPANFR